ncbi:carboxypeptidase regulatory-like domain-containing protein, partial [Mucilaginibacter corticis]
ADSEKVNRALDNLMLTQGYRRFEWKLLDSALKSNPIFKSEGLKATISGLVTDLRNRPLPNAAVLLVSLNARIKKTTTTDANGRFNFDNLLFADSAKFAVQARDLKNTDHVIIILDSIPQIKIAAQQSFADINIIKANLQKAEDEGTPLKLTGHILKQVNIKDVKLKNEPGVATQGMFSVPDEESADRVIPMNHPELYPTTQTFLQTMIPGVTWQLDNKGHTRLLTMHRTVNFSNSPADAESNDLIPLLNGRPSSYEEIEDLQPDEIIKILLVTKNEAIKNILRTGNSHPAGFILFITKVPGARKQYIPNMANISPKGYNKVRRFYSPRYERPDAGNKQPDLRSTIYWNPYVNTDATGKATFDFYNADGPGKYRVVVEGINAAGELGRQVYTYKVE